MHYKPILIVSGEPNSIFFEIFFKTLEKKKFKSSLILIGSIKLLKLQMKELNYNIKINQISANSLTKSKFNNKLINVIDVEYNCSKPFDKISNKSKNYIENCFKIAFKIINQGTTDKLISGPISKKSFLQTGIHFLLAKRNNVEGNISNELLMIRKSAKDLKIQSAKRLNFFKTHIKRVIYQIIKIFALISQKLILLY